MRYEFPNNFTISQLLEAADRFGFLVDVRGPYPIAIRGLKAMTIRRRRDMLDFISIEAKSV